MDGRAGRGKFLLERNFLPNFTQSGQSGVVKLQINSTQQHLKEALEIEKTDFNLKISQATLLQKSN
jgi:hypothetical protein